MDTYATKHMHVKRVDDAVVLKPHGALMGGDETDELEKLIEKFDNEGLRCLVVNLTDVSMMNSLSISRLIRGHIRFSKRDGKMLLSNLDTRIQNIFVITKLSMVFNTFPTEEKALQSYKEGAK